jgi:hypothetical protein
MGQVFRWVGREAAGWVAGRLGRETAREGTETLAGRIEALTARYGSEAVQGAVRRVGPDAVELVEAAGPHGRLVGSLLARFDEPVMPLARQPRWLELIGQLGDDATREFLIHDGLAEPVIAEVGVHRVG